MIEAYPSTPVRTFKVLGAGGGTFSNTGNTDETIVKTVTMPANSMGPNGVLKISSIWSNNNSVGTKTHRIRLGGISGTILFTVGSTSNISYNDPERTIANAGATNSQVGRNSGTAGAGGSASAVLTAAVDTTAAVDIVFTVQLSDGADNGALRAYSVEVCYG